MWRWLFIGTFIFFGLLSASLLIAFWLYSTAPHNPNTPVFAIGFGLAFGFIGIGIMVLLAFERISKKFDMHAEEDGELMRKIMKESPFFSFSLLYFFALGFYMSIFLLMLPYIRNACA